MFSRLTALASLFFFGLIFSAQAELPKPAALEPQVEFWKRIYSEVGTNGGLIHDSRHLDVVYEKIEFDGERITAAGEKLIAQKKAYYAEILKTLAEGNRSDLSPSQKAVLELWPDGVSNQTLRDAAENVRFQLGQANKFRDGLIRSGAWQPFIEKTFRDKGLPVELTALPHVESSFNPYAYSSVGAAGMWQFMQSTGKRYLKIDYTVDERMDPFKATEAAAKLLTYNYEITGAWPLAITAYNHGAGGMQRAKRELGTDDIAVIVQKYESKSFGFASRNFYTELLAAWEVSSNHEKYFGKLTRHQPVEYESVVLDHYYPAAQIANVLGMDLDTLREHNLALRIPVWKGEKHIPQNYQLWVPKNSRRSQSAATLIASIAPNQRFSTQDQDDFYRVHAGDTISSIAKRFGVSEQGLIAANNLRNRNQIRVGQILQLPAQARQADVASVASVVPSEAPPSSGRYTVRRGDSLLLISRRFNLDEQAIIAANSLRNKNQIYVGQVLLLPTANTPVGNTVRAEAVIAQDTRTAPTSNRLQEIADASTTASPLIDSSTQSSVAPPITNAVATHRVPADTITTTPAKAVDAPQPALSAADNSNITAPQNELGDSRPLLAAADALEVKSFHIFYEVSPDQTIDVEPSETIGHYAEWLEVRASDLRQLNQISSRAPLSVGDRLRLDFSKVTQEVFERRRLEYHRAIQEDFFAHYRVGETQAYTMQSGETLWGVSRKNGNVPLWLLRQYNPNLDLGNLQPGVELIIPKIEDIASNTQ